MTMCLVLRNIVTLIVRSRAVPFVTKLALTLWRLLPPVCLIRRCARPDTQVPDFFNATQQTVS